MSIQFVWEYAISMNIENNEHCKKKYITLNNICFYDIANMKIKGGILRLGFLITLESKRLIKGS